MSGDEVFVLVASFIVGLGGWVLWLVGAVSVAGLRTRRPPVALFAAVIAFAALLILLVLRFAAADDVSGAPGYLLLYFALGLAWLRVAALLFPFAGLNPRDDLIERRNAAAIPAWAGAMIAVACCYAGGNIGNGPGWWVVVFSAGLATAGLAAVWLVVGQTTGLVDAVTIERDRAAGVRLGGWLIVCGVIFGRAVAGDWVSASATLADFASRGWPALVVIVLAIVVERSMASR